MGYLGVFSNSVDATTIGAWKARWELRQPCSLSRLVSVSASVVASQTEMEFYGFAKSNGGRT